MTRVMPVSPPQVAESNSPAVVVISQLAGSLSDAGPHLLDDETSARKELGSAMGCPGAAPEVEMGPGDPSSGHILRSNKAQ